MTRPPCSTASISCPTVRSKKKDVERSKNFVYIHTENHPGSDHAIRNKANNYLIDRELQASGDSFTGMKGLGTQDCAIQESMGTIADRSVEHLGVSDSVVIKLRRFLLETVGDFQKGGVPPGLDPASFRVRSGRFALPKEREFADAIDEKLRIELPGAVDVAAE